MLLLNFLSCLKGASTREYFAALKKTGLHFLRFVSGQQRQCSLFKAIAGLHPQSLRHFTRRSSVLVSQTVRPSYLSHMTADTTWADEYWHLHISDWNKHTDLRAHNFAHSPKLWHQPRLVNFTFASGWGLRGINADILLRILLHSQKLGVIFCNLCHLWQRRLCPTW
jgi:hypothetical protein